MIGFIQFTFEANELNALIEQIAMSMSVMNAMLI